MPINSNLKRLHLVAIVCLVYVFFSCTKNDVIKENNINATDSSTLQINYLAKIKKNLKDSLSANDFFAVDFNITYKIRDVQTKDYFIRIGFQNKKISDDFVLLKTDSIGTIIKAKIVHVQWGDSHERIAGITVVTSALNRKDLTYIKNGNNKNNNVSSSKTAGKVAAGNVSLLMEEEAPAGEQTLPDVVVTGYIYDDPFPYYWYSYDAMLGMGITGGGDTYTYAPSEPFGGGGGYGAAPVLQLDYDHPENVQAIDLKKYLNCFGSTQESNATYTVTIATDIPVDGDPSRFFNWSGATPGHTYIELLKNGTNGLIEQNFGFYPNTSWKTVTGNSLVSKIGNDAGHEYNARYTISVSAAQFQEALNAAQAYSSYKYNIATFNCTDFALDVFNAAGGNLSIPKYQIPGYPNGTTGSNTPQGLYIKLDQMAAAGDTHVQKPGIKGYGDISHGPCD